MTAHPSAPAPAKPELLCPAGEPDAGYAALQQGADAVYLGLPRFSARAEAVNFTPEDLADFIGYAHQLPRPRRVYVALNTLIQQRELPELLSALDCAAEAGADAVIVQDLGALKILREHFPGLAIHASTQLAVHDPAGAAALAELGVRRVILARELGLAEIRAVAALPQIECEVFIHGALCYSYSGLCLFSSHVTGRSANRGRCSYPCRDRFQLLGGRTGHAFSLKDLALPDQAAQLAAAGVAALKIEGRKKNPLYVAAVASFYRRLLDGELTDRPAAEAELKSVFSREWTAGFPGGAARGDLIDPDLVGHRGVPAGRVAAVERREGRAWLRFVTAVPLERHDGLQIELPGESKPFGFAVEELVQVVGRRRENVFELPAGATAEVALPAEAPLPPAGAPVRRASSQSVKHALRLSPRPRPGEHRSRRPIQVELQITAAELRGRAEIRDSANELIAVAAAAQPGTFAPATAPGSAQKAAADAFARSGDTPFTVAGLTCVNPEERFAPKSLLNALRRDLLAELGRQYDAARIARREQLAKRLSTPQLPVPPRAAAGTAKANQNETAAGNDDAFSWALKIDRFSALADFTPEDLSAAAEIAIDIAAEEDHVFYSGLERLRLRVEPERLRLALPALHRAEDCARLDARIARLKGEGWPNWEIANAWGLQALGGPSSPAWAKLNVTADWPLYALNVQAVAQLLDLGMQRVTLSPEDDRDNYAALLQLAADRVQLCAYQDTPLFIGEACPFAALAETGCRQKLCHKPATFVSSHDQQFLAVSRHCRTTVIGRRPFSLAGRLDELRKLGLRRARVDFIWRGHPAAQVRQLWRDLRAGRLPADGHEGNYARGLK